MTLTSNSPSISFGWKLIFFLAAVTALEALAIDMYLPAFPAIAQNFQVSDGAVQQTLSIFLIGLACGQGLYGYFLDRFGRRSPLLFGMGLFVAGTIAVALSPSLEIMLAARFVQALGAAAGLVTPRAIVRDSCDIQTSATIFSMLMQVMTIGPIVAPLIGDFVLGYGGWRSIFFLLSTVGAICIVWGFRVTPETSQPEQRASLPLSQIFSAYYQQMQNPKFAAYTLASGFSLASLFIYISASPFVAIQHFGLTPKQFSYYFAINSIGLILVGQANIYLLKKIPGHRIMQLGVAIHTVAALLLLMAILLNTAGAWLYLSLLGVAVCAFRLISGNLAAITMGQAESNFGIASSLIGFFQYFVAGGIGFLIGMMPNIILTLPIAIATCGFSTWLLFAFAARSSHYAIHK